MNKKLIIGIISVVVVLVLLVTSVSSLVGNNDAGYYQVKQSFPAGNMGVISKAGIYPKMFGTMTEYTLSDTYYFSKSDLDGGDGAEANAIGVRFSGGGTADISGSVKYKLPASGELRLRLHEDFRSDEAIRQDLIRQYVQEVLKNTATLYKPEQTYSGGRGEFVSTFQAQLEQGTYRTKSEQIVTKDAEGNELTETIVSIILDKNGEPIIDKVSPFVTYNVSLIQVSLKDIDYSDSVDALITAKQKSEQEKVLAVAKAEKAKQDTITASEEGKANIAIAKAQADVIKQTAVTQAQQAKEVAELNAEQVKSVAETKAEQQLNVATKNAEAAIQDAQALLTKKTAEADANKLLVQAGLTPLQKAQIEKETAIGVANALAGMDVPQVLVNGGGSGSTSPLDYIGINQALDIVERMDK